MHAKLRTMLRLTRRSEYGLMALAFLARDEDRYTSVKTIVSALHIPRRLLAEVLKDLSRAGLVEAVRGPGGGYRLTTSPEELSLARAVEVLEGPSLVSACSDGGDCDLSAGCLIQSGIHGVARRIRSVLEDYSLADLAAEATGHPIDRVAV